MTVLTWIKIGLLKRGYNRAPDEKQQLQNEPPIIKQRGPQQGPYSTPSAVPPGQWPTEGPKPSKVAVILFYLSVVFTTLGILITIKMSFFEEHTTSKDDEVIKTVGYSMIVVGLLLIMITNCIHNRERILITSYLRGKAEECSLDENSRVKRNLRNANLLLQTDQNISQSEGLVV